MARKALHLKFIAGIAAASIALTGLSTVPARADEDVAKVLGALVGLAILGAVINDAKKDDEVVVKPRPRPDRPVKPKPRPVPARFLLPSRCLRTIETRSGGRINAFGERCLERHYDFARSLPQHCARADRARTKHGDYRVRYSYGARCLKQQGYKIARR